MIETLNQEIEVNNAMILLLSLLAISASSEQALAAVDPPDLSPAKIIKSGEMSTLFELVQISTAVAPNIEVKVSGEGTGISC